MNEKVAKQTKKVHLFRSHSSTVLAKSLRLQLQK